MSWRRKSRSARIFCIDLNLTGKIARVAGPLEEATILEIGPGPGGLTRALLTKGRNA